MYIIELTNKVIKETGIILESSRIDNKPSAENEKKYLRLEVCQG